MTDQYTKSVRKAIRHEELREKLRGIAYIGLLHRLAARAPSLETTEEIAAARLQADIYMKLLNKALPDLKAIEHTGSRRVGVDELTREQLIAIASRGRGSGPNEGRSSDESAEVH